MKSTLAIIAISSILLSGLVFLPGINNSAFSQNAPQPLNFQINGGFQQISQEEAEETNANQVNVTYVATEQPMTLPDGTQVMAQTFNGTIPAPTVRVTQGDVLNVKIINHPNNKLIHSLDHHASTISAVPNFGPINVSDTLEYSFVATQPGFFKAHCEGNAVLGMDQHVFQGMVGGVIVDPIDGYTGYTTVGVENGTNQLTDVQVDAAAKEIQFQFSEYYLGEDGSYDAEAMYNHNPTAAWINGIPFGYDPVITKTPNATTLFMNQGDHARFFVLNHGDIPLNFHIVGETLDRVTDGSIVNGIGKQTYTVGGSNDAIIDVYFDLPGVYAFVNHDYSQLFKGQAGLIVVDDVNNSTSNLLGLTDNANPSNAVPPVSANADDSIPMNVKPYMLGTPLQWDGSNSTATTCPGCPQQQITDESPVTATSAQNDTSAAAGGNTTAQQ
ncbi:MAG: multicopper oxidase domain-containing protein [Thermoproteota archaeon]|nr:multicopper oxidase domain-containing protein [Thermoproteota archaeon]